MSAKRVFGIDLGTTYSCIAYVDEHGKPVVLNNSLNESTTPSVVYFETEDNVVVGRPAKEVLALYPEQCVSTVKRTMGDPDCRWTFFGKTYRPQEISALILRKLADDAEALLADGTKVEDVVITCPAYFGLNEKEATKQAGEIAGLNVLYVIPEPTAAALAYGVDQTEDQTILVYDLGGGTFDVTVIEIRGQSIRVVCTGGDHSLGGKDWDDAVVEYFAHQAAEETGATADSLLDDPETYQEMLIAAEEAKKALRDRERYLHPMHAGGERVKIELTRDKFDEITRGLLERTLSLTEQELETARGKGCDRIDKVLLVGGSTYMRQVEEAVAERFSDLEILQFDPNQAVAKGAALFGHKVALEDEVKRWIAGETGGEAEAVDLDDVAPEVLEEATESVARAHGYSLPGVRQMVNTKIVNVASKSFGVKAYNPEDRLVVFNLVKKNDEVPATVTQQFGTHEENQTHGMIECYENLIAEDQVELSDCPEQLGQAELDLGRPVPKGSPVEIRFELGPDGLLKVYGKDMTSDRDVRAEFMTDGIMTREEVEASAAAPSRGLKVA